MRRRLVWLLGGWVVGTATAAWLRRRVRRGVRRYAPEYLRREVADRASALVSLCAPTLTRVASLLASAWARAQGAALTRCRVDISSTVNRGQHVLLERS